MKTVLLVLLTSVMAMSQTEVTKIITGKAVVMPIGTKASEWNKDYVKITAKISNNLPKNVIFRHYIDVQNMDLYRWYQCQRELYLYVELR